MLKWRIYKKQNLFLPYLASDSDVVVLSMTDCSKIVNH